MKVIYSKRILGPYLMIEPTQCGENKLLVSLSSVYKEGTISWINIKSPPTILGVICRGLENSKRSSSFRVFVCFFFFPCRHVWASSLQAELGLSEHSPSCHRRSKGCSEAQRYCCFALNPTFVAILKTLWRYESSNLFSRRLKGH